MSSHTATRRIDGRGRDEPPCEDVHAAIDSLEPDDHVTIFLPFEPRPLYDVLDERELPYEVDETDDGDWRVDVYGS